MPKQQKQPDRRFNDEADRKARRDKNNAKRELRIKRNGVQRHGRPRGR